MRVLVLGSGAREHALAWRLARDEAVRRVWIAPGNGGTQACAEMVTDLDPLDPSAVARHVSRERYDLVVIGPEAPLAAGVADALEAIAPAFGPRHAAARLESSKAFAKEVMRRAEVPTAASVSVRGLDEGIAALARWASPPVVKADWLAAGKGVVVPETEQQARDAVRDLFAAAPAGGTILLEERLAGVEVSAFALVSGEHVVPLAAARDHKRLGDGDTGPNTGGMGALTPVNGFGTRQLEEAAERIFAPVAWRLARDGMPYRGVLYAGLMLTDAGPMVLEFNARFGDPEAQVLLPLVDGDLSGALLGAATGDRGLMEGSIVMRPGAAVGVVIAAEGYPEDPVRGRPIGGVDPSGPDDGGPLLYFHGATRRIPGGHATTGGRVVTVVGLGDDVASARAVAYRGVAGVELEGAQHRSDIGLEVGLAGT
ncbi:MAG: phosphoribosylamine--glycine ligase [Chloroflexota bacterium]